MRIIITARAALVSGHKSILDRIVSILGAVSRNPSNPNFNQYTFEAVSALIRYITLIPRIGVSNRFQFHCSCIPSIPSSI